MARMSDELRLASGVSAYESGSQPDLREVVRRLELLEAWQAEVSAVRTVKRGLQWVVVDHDAA